MEEDKLVEALRSILKEGKDWERKKTTVPGVFVLKLPAQKRSPGSLAVELNPVDELGNPKKRRGLVLRSYGELEEFREILNQEKLDKLLKALDQVNPRESRRVPRREEGALEI